MSKKINVGSLSSGYSIYGNKGAVWNDSAHIYKSGSGCLCGIPTLSSNWARIQDVRHIGCQGCIDAYMREVYEVGDKFARVCDISGLGMSEGYVVNDGAMYIADKQDAEMIAKQNGYDSLQSAYDDGHIYYTEWQSVDEECYEWDGSKFNEID